MFVIKTRIYI